MINLIFIRLLNGLQIKYNLYDLLAYIKFLIKPISIENISTYSLSNLKIKVIVISLPFRNDRRTQIQKQLNRFNIEFEFFDSIHGKTERSKSFEIVEFSLRSKKYLSPGSIGCIASHISVWYNLSLSSYDCFLILEDDVILEKDFAEIIQSLNHVPFNADIIYLGSGSLKGWPNMKKVSEVFSKAFSIRKGAYGYFLFKKGAITLINEIKKVDIVCGGIDSLLGIYSMRGKINSYHIMPPICTVDYNSPSNILNVSKRTKKVQEIEYI